MSKTNEYKIEMGRRIQQARKAARLTQMRFAEEIDVSTQYVSDLERGIVGCSVPTLIKICDTLETSADYILRGHEPEPPKPPAEPEELSALSPQERELVKEGFQLLKKPFHWKKAYDKIPPKMPFEASAGD